MASWKACKSVEIFLAPVNLYGELTGTPIDWSSSASNDMLKATK